MSPPPEPPTARQTRSIVTEEALSVSPAVLGLPLAAPWRRAVAIGIDGILAAILAGLANTPSVLFGAAVAVALFRLSRRRVQGMGFMRRSLRFMLRFGAAVVLFGVAMKLGGAIGDRFSGEDDADDRSASIAGSGDGPAEMTLSGMDAARFATDVLALRRANDEADARAATERLLARMQASGVQRSEARDAVREMADSDEEKPWMAAVVETVLANDEAAELAGGSNGEAVEVAAPSADSLMLAYSAALAASDTSAAAALRPQLVNLFAADTVRALDSQIEAIDEERDELAARVGELEGELEEGPSVMSVLRSLTNDLGLGLGWFGLYFTATTALWHGRTPGKRLLGIRVIRLTGKPIGWWASFERFGGYAAGVATGLLGFLQIFWDDNRQATHDKIAGTTVIRD